MRSAGLVSGLLRQGNTPGDGSDAIPLRFGSLIGETAATAGHKKDGEDDV